MLNDREAFGLIFDRASRVHLFAWLCAVIAGAKP
jgi:hypothetical protein